MAKRTRTKPVPSAKRTTRARSATKKTKTLSVLEALEQALRRSQFNRRFPQLQLQVRRLGKLLAIQQEMTNREFSPGTCFLHAHLPTSESFCIRSLLEIDLDAATAVFSIYGDDVLEAGHVILPLEHLTWIGFPDTEVNVGVRFVGFHLPSSRKKPLLVK